MEPNLIVETPDTASGHRMFTLPNGHVDTAVIVSVFARLSAPGLQRGPDWIGFAAPSQQHTMGSARTGLIKVAVLGVDNLSEERATDVEKRLREVAEFVPRLVQHINARSLAAHLVIQTDLLVPYWNPLWTDKNPIDPQRFSQSAKDGRWWTKSKYVAALVGIALLIAIVPGIHHFLSPAEEQTQVQPKSDTSTLPQDGPRSETPSETDGSRPAAELGASAANEVASKILESAQDQGKNRLHWAIAQIEDRSDYKEVLPLLVAGLIKRARQEFNQALEAANKPESAGQPGSRRATVPAPVKRAADFGRLRRAADEYLATCDETVSHYNKGEISDETLAGIPFKTKVKTNDKADDKTNEGHAARLWQELFGAEAVVDVSLKCETPSKGNNLLGRWERESVPRLTLGEIHLYGRDTGTEIPHQEYSSGDKQPQKMRLRYTLRELVQGGPDRWVIHVRRADEADNSPTDPTIAIDFRQDFKPSVATVRHAPESDATESAQTGLNWAKRQSDLEAVVKINMSLELRDETRLLVLSLLGLKAKVPADRSH